MNESYRQIFNLSPKKKKEEKKEEEDKEKMPKIDRKTLNDTGLIVQDLNGIEPVTSCYNPNDDPLLR